MKGMTMPFAIVVAKSNLDVITVLNGGVRPEIEEPPSIFVAHGKRNAYNEILSLNEFFANYYFAEDVVLTQFNKVIKR